MTKVKANDKISFPLELDMQPQLDAGEAEGRHQYELQAILIHRGSNASSGHYGEPSIRLSAAVQGGLLCAQSSIDYMPMQRVQLPCEAVLMTHTFDADCSCLLQLLRSEGPSNGGISAASC